jgi:hypothetical protein
MLAAAKIRIPARISHIIVSMNSGMSLFLANLPGKPGPAAMIFLKFRRATIPDFDPTSRFTSLPQKLRSFAAADAR